MECLITDLETILPGCKPRSGGVIHFGILLWLSLLLNDIFIVYTVSQGEVRDAGVEPWYL